MFRPPSRCKRALVALLAAGIGWVANGAAQARCNADDDAGSVADLAPAPGADARASRLTLRGLVAVALQRSQAIGASKLLAEAAASDLKETQAAGLPQASLSGNAGLVGDRAPYANDTQGAQARANLNLTSLLYDGGRLERLSGWRRNLAEAARFGELSAEEQIALQTVTLALDRSRYASQVGVYEQFTRSMACLVDSLEQIAGLDRGRTSELIQARKSQQQAELSRTQAASSLRLTETRLRRYVGEALPETPGLATVLLDLPPLGEVQAEAERSLEIGQLGAQAAALDEYSRSVEAGHRPQLSWIASGSQGLGTGRSTGLTLGVNLVVPLYDPALTHSIDAAQRRAEAARLQRGDALVALRSRMAEVHELAASAFDRARDMVEIIRNSDLVRDATIQQWQQMGRRSLFDVVAAQGDLYSLRVAYVNAVCDAQQSNALLRSLGLGIGPWLDRS